MSGRHLELEMLQRAALHRRAVILDGHIADLMATDGIAEAQRWARAEGSISVARWVSRAILAASPAYECAVIIGPDGRLEFDDPQHRQRFATLYFGATVELMGENGGGDAYGSYGDFAQELPQTLRPDEVMGLIERFAQAGRGGFVAVFDFAHLQVSDPSRLQGEDRAWALAFSRAVAAEPHAASEGATAPFMVLLARSLRGLPPVVYQNDPRVQLIHLGAPNREARQRFFEAHLEALRLRPLAPRPGDRRSDRARLIEVMVDLTEGLMRVDLRQIVDLSQRMTDALPPQRLMNLYRYGDQRSPWEELDADKVRGIDAALQARVFGQDTAVAHLGNMVRRAYLGLSGLQHSAQSASPKGRLFFAGPTGVGKTELAKALAEFLFGDERACLRFDMSEYNHEHSDQRLVGAPPGYVGFEEGGQLTNAVRARPFSVLLFDEIEKAHGRILDKFLQILEDGRLTDGRGETAWFGETVIIFTSNLGAAEMPEGLDEAARQAHFRRAVERHFVTELKRPELLNRLGENILAFAPVTDAEVRGQLLERKLEPVAAHLSERFGVGLLIDAEAKRFILRQARLEHGGRGLLNAIERVLLSGLADYLFDHEHQLMSGRRIHVGASEAGLRFELRGA
ncbi:AAA family ATPase [Myxococcota bacterium]|nr:AAA family ATPase [Myxococcota bacterium]MBU1432730.1 AAA family ATPase [Myxococcota bacterium]MBU1900363.1 AAA family ATPase [Myxococcota bacterium]